MHVKDRKQVFLACLPVCFPIIYNLDLAILENSLEFEMLSIHLPCDPTILFIEICPREIRAYV